MAGPTGLSAPLSCKSDRCSVLAGLSSPACTAESVRSTTTKRSPKAALDILVCFLAYCWTLTHSVKYNFILP
jgi:hypothetical protein